MSERFLQSTRRYVAQSPAASLFPLRAKRSGSSSFSKRIISAMRSVNHRILASRWITRSLCIALQACTYTFFDFCVAAAHCCSWNAVELTCTGACTVIMFIRSAGLKIGSIKRRRVYRGVIVQLDKFLCFSLKIECGNNRVEA